jgi:hypothetical protein
VANSAAALFLQVVDKDADAVLDEIEATILEVAQSILAGSGYSFDIPSRAKGMQNSMHSILLMLGIDLLKHLVSVATSVCAVFVCFADYELQVSNAP